MCHPTCTSALFTGLYSLTQVSNSFNGLVEVIVGPQKQLFRLHKEILCNVSSYFRAALEGSFAEGLTQKIELPEDDVTVFKCFRVWLYSFSQGSLPSAPESENEFEFETQLEPDVIIGPKDLFDLYIFADMRNIPLLQNSTVDTIIWISERKIFVIGDLILYVYDRTALRAPLRKLLVDWWLNFSDSTWLEEQHYGNYSKRFLFDVALAQSKLGPRGIKKAHDFWEARTDYYV